MPTDAQPQDADDLPMGLAPWEDPVQKKTLTQADIDANADANGRDTSSLVVADIPGVFTAARPGEREGWRAIRGKTWSATTVTTIVGSNPFATRMDLWRERIMGIAPTFSDFGKRIMQYGTDAEPELLEEANDFALAEAPPFTLVKKFTLTHGYVVDSRENPHYGCTPDAFRIVPLESGTTNEATRLELAEFKTGSKAWGGKVPQNYVDQMLWQMMVTGARRVLAVQRQVKRDRQGNVTAVLGHEHVWVEYDQARVDVILAAVAEWEVMEAEGNPPMTYIDLEDQFDDEPDTTAEKSMLRGDLEYIAAAERAYADVDRRYKTGVAHAKARVKAALAERKGMEVTARHDGYGATLSRSTRTGYDVSLLTDKQRERIRTSTPVETLRTGAGKGE